MEELLETPNIPEAPPRPFDDREMWALYNRPHALLDVVLAQWPRLVATVREDHHTRLLAAAMLAASLLCTLPYGMVVGIDAAWRIPALFLGSLLICFPALHVFAAYIGGRNTLGQNLALALVMSTTAGFFTLAFAPIVWFLGATSADQASIGAGQLSAAFLAVAFLGGLGHLNRCVWARGESAGGRFVVMTWQILLGFITLRMAYAIGLA